jgi:hypothetical protein
MQVGKDAACLVFLPRELCRQPVYFPKYAGICLCPLSDSAYGWCFEHEIFKEGSF